MKNKPIYFGDIAVQPGEHLTVALPTPEVYSCVPMYIPVHVFHGKKSGPCLLICAAFHGDEMNGISLIQRFLQLQLLKSLQGTLIAVPVVNIYGLITHSRNLPDRRDLNESFPGHEQGTFAARLAHHISKEILDKADYCVDIHTGQPHVCKMPQVQTDIRHLESKQMAENFQAPILLHTEDNKGMLWQIKDKNKPTIVYQTGEALRLDELGIRIGIRGIVRLMRSLGMLKLQRVMKTSPIVTITSTEWIRASKSGLCRLSKNNSSRVQKGDLIFRIADPFGSAPVFAEHATQEGIVITQNNFPLVNEGDPILQIGRPMNTLSSSHFDLWRDNIQVE